jgi:hypothetical protein
VGRGAGEAVLGRRGLNRYGRRVQDLDGWIDALKAGRADDGGDIVGKLA